MTRATRSLARWMSALLIAVAISVMAIITVPAEITIWAVGAAYLLLAVMITRVMFILMTRATTLGRW